MAYSPSPSASAPHSPHLSGLRSASSVAAAAAAAALVDQEKYHPTHKIYLAFFFPIVRSYWNWSYVWLRYLSELLEERHKLTPFMPVLPHSYRLLSQGRSVLVSHSILLPYISTYYKVDKMGPISYCQLVKSISNGRSGWSFTSLILIYIFFKKGHTSWFIHCTRVYSDRVFPFLDPWRSCTEQNL